MNAKERVKAAVNFGGPDKIPYLISIDKRRWRNARPDDARVVMRLHEAARADFFTVRPHAPPGAPPTSQDCAGLDGGTDEWGATWRDSFVSRHPFEGEDFDADGMPFPDPLGAGRFDEADRQIAAGQDRYVLAMVWFTMFERCHILRGFEQALTDPLLHPRANRRLKDRLLEYNLAVLDAFIARGVDGVFFSDDWGTNTQLLIKPETWRQEWLPYYETLFGRARERGLDVWLHSDGNLFEILDDLIGAGLNVLNPLQPRAMPVPETARRAGGRLCFYGGVDVQHTLPYGTPEQVKAEVNDLVEQLGRFNGGYIGGVSHTLLPDVPLGNAVALYEAFEDLGA